MKILQQFWEKLKSFFLKETLTPFENIVLGIVKDGLVVREFSLRQEVDLEMLNKLKINNNLIKSGFLLIFCHQTPEGDIFFVDLTTANNEDNERYLEIVATYKDNEVMIEKGSALYHSIKDVIKKEQTINEQIQIWAKNSNFNEVM